MYTHYMKKPKYTYTLIYINILGPPPIVLKKSNSVTFLSHKEDFEKISVKKV